MCDGAVFKTIFNKPVDVLGDVYTNDDLTMASGKKVEDNQVQSVSGNILLYYHKIHRVAMFNLAIQQPGIATLQTLLIWLLDYLQHRLIIELF